MDLEELIPFLIQERLNAFYGNRRVEMVDTQKEECDEWEELLQQCAPMLEEKLQEHMNQVLESQGEEVEEAYKFGFNDGIRLMKWLMEIK